MGFLEILDLTAALLERDKRVSYGALKRIFDLDDGYLEDLKFELIQIRRLSVDQGGEILVWARDARSALEAAPSPALIAQPAIPPAEPPTQVVHPPQLLEISPAVEPVASDAERRPLTVMFCDLADSTALSVRLDPEDLQDVIRAYQDICTGIVREYEGFVAKYMGDGILVYFGCPKSLERNAERAVRSGSRSSRRWPG